MNRKMVRWVGRMFLLGCVLLPLHPFGVGAAWAVAEPDEKPDVPPRPPNEMLEPNPMIVSGIAGEDDSHRLLLRLTPARCPLRGARASHRVGPGVQV